MGLPTRYLCQEHATRWNVSVSLPKADSNLMKSLTVLETTRPPFTWILWPLHTCVGGNRLFRMFDVPMSVHCLIIHFNLRCANILGTYFEAAAWRT